MSEHVKHLDRICMRVHRECKERHVFPNKKNSACALAQSSLSLYFSNCLMQLLISLMFIFYNVVPSQSRFQTRDIMLHNDGFWVMMLCLSYE